MAIVMSDFFVHGFVNYLLICRSVLDKKLGSLQSNIIWRMLIFKCLNRNWIYNVEMWLYFLNAPFGCKENLNSFLFFVANGSVRDEDNVLMPHVQYCMIMIMCFVLTGDFDSMHMIFLKKMDVPSFSFKW